MVSNQKKMGQELPEDFKIKMRYQTILSIKVKKTKTKQRKTECETE